jgi:anti-anti-sigma factor
MLAGGIAVIALEGELDLESTPALEAEVDRLIEHERPRGVVFDLRELAFIDSTGLRAVIQTDQRLRSDNCPFALVPGAESVQRVFEVTGMYEHLRWVDEPSALDPGPGGATLPVRVDIELPSHPDSVGRARSALLQVSDHVSPDCLEDLRLLVSELVTNAIRHSGASSDDVVRLLVEVDESRVRIEVHDPGRGFVPPEPEPDPARSGGWGLYLVGELADRWGVEDAGGSHVWFEVARESAA